MQELTSQANQRLWEMSWDLNHKIISLNPEPHMHTHIQISKLRLWELNWDFNYSPEKVRQNWWAESNQIDCLLKEKDQHFPEDYKRTESTQNIFNVQDKQKNYLVLKNKKICPIQNEKQNHQMSNKKRPRYWNYEA